MSSSTSTTTCFICSSITSQNQNDNNDVDQEEKSSTKQDSYSLALIQLFNFRKYYTTSRITSSSTRMVNFDINNVKQEPPEEAVEEEESTLSNYYSSWIDRHDKCQDQDLNKRLTLLSRNLYCIKCSESLHKLTKILEELVLLESQLRQIQKETFDLLNASLNKKMRRRSTSECCNDDDDDELTQLKLDIIQNYKSQQSQQLDLNLKIYNVVGNSTSWRWGQTTDDDDLRNNTGSIAAEMLKTQKFTSSSKNESCENPKNPFVSLVRLEESLPDYAHYCQREKERLTRVPEFDDDDPDSLVLESGRNDEDYSDNNNFSRVKVSSKKSSTSQETDKPCIKLKVKSKSAAAGPTSSAPPQDLKYSCNLCPKQYNNLHNLRTHKRRIHCITETPWKCNTCSESFQSLRSLYQHKHSEHKTNPIKCSICPETFKGMYSLKKHMRVSHGKTLRDVICQTCGLTFPKSQDLKYHQHSKHPDIFTGSLHKCKCNDCNHIYCNPAALRNHIKFQHQKQFPYTCHVCGLGLTVKSRFKWHLISHSSERNYPCPNCSKTFKLPAALNVHMKRHTGTGLLTCPTCDKKFLTTGALARHEQIHSGELKYVCSHCGKGFPVQNYLYIHMRSHETDEQKAIRKAKAKVTIIK